MLIAVQDEGRQPLPHTCMVQYIQNVNGLCLASSNLLSWPVFHTRTTKKPPRRTAHATTKAVATIYRWCTATHASIRSQQLSSSSCRVG